LCAFVFCLCGCTFRRVMYQCCYFLYDMAVIMSLIKKNQSGLIYTRFAAVVDASCAPPHSPPLPPTLAPPHMQLPAAKTTQPTANRHERSSRAATRSGWRHPGSVALSLRRRQGRWRRRAPWGARWPCPARDHQEGERAASPPSSGASRARRPLGQRRDSGKRPSEGR
jgi:hypothetical protein